ncbi:glucokinase [Roseibium hamelinense]|uniref:Glucokinase n=1 Tax=Roseibium hamelinense TaxID=150831 RepID=A0A562SIZ2_9HYPH|nr:glucokinase [Roseibium hamelinense]MTI43949.1 glucokinase [Roseibium hamelinense]TWI80756.1 glucokinase [Roseibium hamelinense]
MNLRNRQQTAFAFPVLVADIGGTNARFALVKGPGSPTQIIGTTATADHDTLTDAIKSCALTAAGEKPKTAIIAVAGPVTGDRIPLTNAAWVIEPNAMISDLALEEVVVLNDFEAQALALPNLEGEDLQQIGSGTPLPASTKFVLGPGTGLGAAAMIYAADTWIPVPGEGGHVELGPVSDEDFAIWDHIEKVGGRIGAEHLLSGTGMPRLARAVRSAEQADGTYTSAAEVTQAADAGDPVAVKTLRLFAKALGRVAGDFALSLLARGGVYLTGGVTPRIADYLVTGAFRSSFETKAPHEALLRTIPTFIVRHPNPALEGLACYARHPENFAVSLTGRHWQSAIAPHRRTG